MAFMISMPVIELAGLTIQVCQFDPQQFDEAQQRYLASPTYHSLHKAVIKRQAEFVAGRKLAQQALKQIGQGYDRPIAIGTHREPLWPAGITGSIAHCDGWAVCTVLKAEHLSLGIDIEHRLAHQTASEVQAMIGTAQEWALLAQQFDLASAVTLLFSAKESLFKALFPQVQIYLAFSDAQLIGLDGNQLTLRLSIDRKPLIPDADYKVHFVWQESRVISAIRQIKRVSGC
ncbi:4'-phosphopantetheinyl transferase superfamily protein [Vibrio cholerae]|uniref:4'-phosphopantetheinyl transferase family protein n=1 Tax=Vibrio cholerae TaxID=666 RepID=UPI00115A7919|nr:4'-phosphopantetheinyl transferase [Vibrio cholerae]TQQ49717.1 4'-phosphopantetheinyl transferase superfamily protein [Vibrio cholerae]